MCVLLLLLICLLFVVSVCLSVCFVVRLLASSCWDSRLCLEDTKYPSISPLLADKNIPSFFREWVSLRNCAHIHPHTHVQHRYDKAHRIQYRKMADCCQLIRLLNDNDHDQLHQIACTQVSRVRELNNLMSFYVVLSRFCRVFIDISRWWVVDINKTSQFYWNVNLNTSFHIYSIG